MVIYGMPVEKCKKKDVSYSFDVGRFVIQTVLDDECSIIGYDVILDGDRKIKRFFLKEEAIDFARQWMQRLSEIEQETIDRMRQ